MVNIPGISGYKTPQVLSRTRTQSKSVAIPGGSRTLCIMGLGEREETLIESARGEGLDGRNSSYTSLQGADGRHFLITGAPAPYVSNRTSLYKNGSPLRVLEQQIDTDPFDDRYDARFDKATGRIELKRASLVDLGGANFSAASSNTGTGTISTLELLDPNAPAETWTLRAAFFIRDGSGNPILGETKFSLSGTVSGQILDGYGAPFLFKVNEENDNGILSLTVTEGATLFQKGDRFSIQVDSGVLSQNDNLVVKYISEFDINRPELFDEPEDLFNKHGRPLETNTLAVGAQMAFENGANQILTIQCKPPLPRRTSEILLQPNDPLTDSLDEGATGNASLTDLTFALAPGSKPDKDTEVHVFIMDEDGTEEQIFPNKVSFYNQDNNNDEGFVFHTSNTYSYTMIESVEVEQSGSDGEVRIPGAQFSNGAFSDGYMFYSPSLNVKASDLGKSIKITAPAAANTHRLITGIVDKHTVLLGTFVGGGLTSAYGFDENNMTWFMLDDIETSEVDADVSTDTSTKLILSDDLALAAKKGLRVTYIDQKDADFFDANWFEALDELEAEDLQILVPLPDQTFSAIQQAARVHCELMSAIGKKRERVLLTGAQMGVTDLAIIGREEVAVEDIGVIEGIQGDDPEEILASNIEDLQNFHIRDNFGGTFRVGYFYPDKILRVINGERKEVHGFYVAAAAGGRLAGTGNVALPLTFQVLSGFEIPRDKTYKDERLDELGDAGAIVIVPVTGGGKVLHGRTTTVSGFPEEEELSVIFIRDHVANVLRLGVQGFIGKLQDATLIASITARMKGLLDGLVFQEILTGYSDLSVRRNPVEPRQIDVTVAVNPIIPVNHIFIDISVGIV